MLTGGSNFAGFMKFVELLVEEDFITFLKSQLEKVSRWLTLSSVPALLCLRGGSDDADDVAAAPQLCPTFAPQKAAVQLCTLHSFASSCLERKCQCPPASCVKVLPMIRVLMNV